MKNYRFKLNCGYKIKPSFYVSPEQGIVVAKAKLPKIVDIVNNKILNGMDLGFTEEFYDSLEYGRTVCGKAKCCKEDTFDEAIGKELAVVRLKNRLNSMIEKRVEKVYQEVIKAEKRFFWSKVFPHSTC